jgi:hypothetical protein
MSESTLASVVSRMRSSYDDDGTYVVAMQ